MVGLVWGGGIGIKGTQLQLNNNKKLKLKKEAEEQRSSIGAIVWLEEGDIQEFPNAKMKSGKKDHK